MIRHSKVVHTSYSEKLYTDRIIYMDDIDGYVMIISPIGIRPRGM